MDETIREPVKANEKHIHQGALVREREANYGHDPVMI